MSRITESVRQQVRERAKSRCEYCRIPETVVHFSHQVDHIVPPRHGGSDGLDNLAWACFRCNNHKGTDIATYDLDANERVFLFNPRTQDWLQHFALDHSGLIRGITAVGRATARLLQMNVPERVEARRTLLQAEQWQD